MRALACLLLLCACSSSPEQPGGFTADDQRQLNEAAEMLDANSMDPMTTANSASESPAP